MGGVVTYFRVYVSSQFKMDLYSNYEILILVLARDSKQFLRSKCGRHIMRNSMLVATIVAAIVIMAAVPFGFLSDGDSSTDTYGEFDFYIYSGGQTEKITGTGFDAKVALQDACADNNIPLTFATIIDSNGVSVSGDEYIYSTENDYGPYDTINAGYGTIDTFNGSSNFTIYYHNTDGTWDEAVDAIGFYRPFADYDPKFTTATFAIIIGDMPADMAFPTTPHAIVGMDQIINNPDFQVTLHFRLNPLAEEGDYYGTPTIPLSQIQNKIEVVYGSSVYAALKTVPNADVYGYDTVSYESEGVTYISTMYGYVEDVFGLEYNADNGYYYWSTYTGDSTLDSWNNYCSYMFGYYSPLSEVPESSILCGDEFTLIYTM